MRIDKISMVERLVSHYANGNKSKFAALLGVKPQTISAWITRNTFDSELIFAKCAGVSSSWLLTGEGEMLKSGGASSMQIQNGHHNIQAHGGVVAAPDASELVDLRVELAAAKAIIEQQRSTIEMLRELLQAR